MLDANRMEASKTRTQARSSGAPTAHCRSVTERWPSGLKSSSLLVVTPMQSAATTHAGPRRTQGELAFRAVSYTPWPVEQGFEGDRVRIGVGAVREPQLRTYVFEKCGLARLCTHDTCSTCPHQGCMYVALQFMS